jgi:hypothetical protein
MQRAGKNPFTPHEAYCNGEDANLPNPTMLHQTPYRQ